VSLGTRLRGRSSIRLLAETHESARNGPISTRAGTTVVPLGLLRARNLAQAGRSSLARVSCRKRRSMSFLLVHLLSDKEPLGRKTAERLVVLSALKRLVAAAGV